MKAIFVNIPNKMEWGTWKLRITPGNVISSKIQKNARNLLLFKKNFSSNQKWLEKLNCGNPNLQIQHYNVCYSAFPLIKPEN